MQGIKPRDDERYSLISDIYHPKAPPRFLVDEVY